MLPCYFRYLDCSIFKMTFDKTFMEKISVFQSSSQTSYKFLGTVHYVKSVRIRNYSGLYFPAFELNTERYFVSLLIQSKCGKKRIRITPNTDTFDAVVSIKMAVVGIITKIFERSLFYS